MVRKWRNRRGTKTAIIKNGATMFTILRTKGLKERILVLVGQFKKPTEISAILKEEYPEFHKKANETILKLISNITYENRNYVNVLKEQYAKEIMEVPGAHKRVRLDRLEVLYDRDKVISGKRETVKAMREEMEGARVNLNLYQLNILGGLSDEELVRREREIVERIRVDTGRKAEASEGTGISILPASLEAEVVSSV